MATGACSLAEYEAMMSAKVAASVEAAMAFMDGQGSHAMFTPYLGRAEANATRLSLVLLQHPDDLLLREPYSLHRPSPSDELCFRPGTLQRAGPDRLRWRDIKFRLALLASRNVSS